MSKSNKLLRKDMIYHIYWGTSGNAGLYLDEIYQVLNKCSYKQKAFVSYYYPFNYAQKIFFKRTEMEHCRYRGTLRKILQAYELFLGLTYVLMKSLIDKPNVINYSYSGWGNRLIYFFLKFLRLTNRGVIVITCHDVIPSKRDEDHYQNEVKIKSKIYGLADYFLVHNENSINDLERFFGIEKKKILVHAFPLMDLSKLDKENKKVPVKYDYLFIGHMRKEKGVYFLVDSWVEFHKIKPEATLCIAGNVANSEGFINTASNLLLKSNVVLKVGFISDNEYIELIKASNCVVFPYISGTNSGVISTVLSLGKNVITSDIPMFTNHPLVSSCNMYESQNRDSFIFKLIEFYHKNDDNEILTRIRKYREVFRQQVQDVYSQLCKL